MDAHNTIDGDDTSNSWSAETNWTISDGSLHDSVVFESSDSPIDAITPNSAVKSPLLLKPPAPDSGFCEIKISLREKHEIRQVYVRSTARVYEIYFSPHLQSDNEYLCTVSCGIAAREKEILGSTESVRTGLEGSDEVLDGGKVKDDGNIVTSEDDWVEVKAPDAPILVSKNNSIQGENAANIESTSQDFYEASAEITDGDPCISITIRLLSLQNKGFVYVDELYVFADPIESSDTENQAGNLSQSSLMAMLLPTFLNLPKTGTSQLRNAHGLDDTRERIEQPKICSSMTSDVINAEREVKLPHTNKETAEPVQAQIPSPVLDREEKPDSVAKSDLPLGHIERTLEELVSRVHRIEDICLRFEENMLKPILGMEARLQRVEKQMEAFSKNSCNDSNSSTFCNDGSEYPACGQVSNLPHDESISVNDTRLHPCLAVTAPEFSCGAEEEKDSGDEENNGNICEPMKDSPQEKPKQGLSIDDALAAAFAGFVSTTTVERANYTRVLSVKAPEFSVEENSHVDDELTSPKFQKDEQIVDFQSSTESNGNECMKRSVEENSDVDELTLPKFQKDEHIVDFHSSTESNGKECMKKSVSSLSYASSEDVEQVAVNLNDGQLEVPSENEKEYSSEAFHGHDAADKLDIKRESELEMLQNGFLYLPAISTVDFDAPIFDVKFASSGFSSSNSALEDLLTDREDFDRQDSCSRQEQQLDDDDDVQIGDLIPLEVEGLMVHPTRDGFLVDDLESYAVKDAQDPFSCSSDSCGQETSASLI